MNEYVKCEWGWWVYDAMAHPDDETHTPLVCGDDTQMSCARGCPLFHWESIKEPKKKKEEKGGKKKKGEKCKLRAGAR